MNKHLRKPCYICQENNAIAHSNFCEECLPENRPLYFPTATKQPIPPFTMMLLLLGIASAAWCLFKTIAFVMQ